MADDLMRKLESDGDVYRLVKVIFIVTILLLVVDLMILRRINAD